jgi:hypothetical protein
LINSRIHAAFDNNGNVIVDTGSAEEAVKNHLNLQNR